MHLVPERIYTVLIKLTFIVSDDAPDPKRDWVFWGASSLKTNTRGFVYACECVCVKRGREGFEKEGAIEYELCGGTTKR